MNSKPTDITILGSTGSIGTQTLDVIAEHPECFRASILTAGRNWQLLADQARKFRPQLVVIDSEDGYSRLKEALHGEGIEIACGRKALIDAATALHDDIVVGALVGYAGLEPTLAAIRQGKRIALANKETLVAGGEIMTRECHASGARLLPVDSEHSAIFQCLQGEKHHAIEKLILTASGGPFRTLPREELVSVTPDRALRHPNWDMGAKVTIDSASMLNKGFEMIEARWLFDIDPGRIDILVHPQSIVHSLVQFVDGSVKAQLGLADMRIPIRYALGYPRRLSSLAPRLDLAATPSLQFERPDMEKFPLLPLAFQAIETGGTAPAILNAANEIAVRAFLDGKIRFTDMPRVAMETLSRVDVTHVDSLDDIRQAHNLATEAAIRETSKISNT